MVPALAEVGCACSLRSPLPAAALHWSGVTDKDGHAICQAGADVRVGLASVCPAIATVHPGFCSPFTREPSHLPQNGGAQFMHNSPLDVPR